MKTMKLNKIFLPMAALALVGAMTAGCSSDDLATDTPLLPDAAGGTVTMKTTITLDERASTRALDADGKKTFAAGDQIAVIYQNTSGETIKAVSAALTTDDIDATNAQNATFSVSLTNPKASTPVRYIYPASRAAETVVTTTAPNDDATIKYDALATQVGTFDKIASDLDLSVFDGEMTAQAVLPAATLVNPLTIAKFTITNSATDDITNTVNSLTVNDGTNIYIVKPSSLSTIYVAMKPTSGDIATTATTTDSKTYFKTATGNTLAAGNLYSISVSMVELAIGNVFCSDGSVYASKDAATTAGKTPVALICYLGNDAETSPSNTAYKHGLALALTDANGGNTAAWCSQMTALCLTTQYKTEAEVKTDMAGIANTDALVGHATHTHDAANAARNYNSGSHPIGTSEWFLPSGGQWDKMITASGGYETLRSKASLGYKLCWASTESSPQWALLYWFSSGSWSTDLKVSKRVVRSALAF